MAQIDTGLGWSAKDTWLKSVSGLIGNMGGLVSNIPGETPLNTCEYIKNDIIAVGTLYDDARPDFPFHSYVAGATGTDFFVFYVPSEEPDRYLLICVTNTYGAHVYFAQAGGSGLWDNQATSSSPNFPGLYFYQWAYVSANNLQSTIPLYQTVAEGLSHYSISNQPVYKLNSGYAVVCFATWWTPAGEKITSPVLISSERNNTVISYDGSSVATQVQESVVYNGLVFYMSYDLSLTGTPTGTVEIVDLTQFGAALGPKVFRLLASETFANILITAPPPDPYEEETDPSEEEGGGGSDLEDDPVEEETLPLPAVVGLGFSTIYVPTQADLYNLASYMWGGNLDLDNFLKLFANPMDSILGLSAVPLVLSGTYEPIYLGGQQLQGITMPRYTGRTSVKVDMGTTTIDKRWGAYLDYDPYTELAIYVPFIGIKNIKADDVMEKTVRLMYNIDILSGACVAYLRTEGGSVLYEWSGQCAVQIPITGANWDNIFSTAVSTAATLGGALFAPASAPVLGGAVASAAVQAVAAKPRIERSGAMNGITGFLGQLRPYILRTTPEAYIPGDQNKFIGYPSYMSVSLGSLSGYNEIASIHLENIPATADELAELESILKGGVIF